LVAGCGPATVLAGLDTGDSGSNNDGKGGRDTTSDGTNAGDAAFVCTPPANATQAPVTFTGALFDEAQGCLVGAPVTLPICGCFTSEGGDTATWCFVSPNGIAYFSVSDDGCTIQMPASWYAVQNTATGPGTSLGTPTATQKDACARVGATSTAQGSYDLPGPPQCNADGGAMTEAAAPKDAGTCVNIDLSTYDRSCTTDSDCIAVTPGEVCPCLGLKSDDLCPSGCGFPGGGSVNQSAYKRYQTAVAAVEFMNTCNGYIVDGFAECKAGQCEFFNEDTGTYSP
jgi:hypothetical protein